MAAKRKHKVSARKTSKSIAASKPAAHKAKRTLKLVSARSSEQKKAGKAGGTSDVSDSVKARKTTKKQTSSGISRRLLEAIERRKKERGDDGESRIAKLFKKPVGRRGRRPKNVEYGASNGSDDEFTATDSEAERLEYDTGIKVGFSVDGDSTTFERSDDYDEELDFG